MYNQEEEVEETYNDFLKNLKINTELLGIESEALLKLKRKKTIYNISEEYIDEVVIYQPLKYPPNSNPPTQNQY